MGELGGAEWPELGLGDRFGAGSGKTSRVKCALLIYRGPGVRIGWLVA